MDLPGLPGRSLTFSRESCICIAPNLPSLLSCHLGASHPREHTVKSCFSAPSAREILLGKLQYGPRGRAGKYCSKSPLRPKSFAGLHTGGVGQRFSCVCLCDSRVLRNACLRHINGRTGPSTVEDYMSRAASLQVPSSRTSYGNTQTGSGKTITEAILLCYQCLVQTTKHPKYDGFQVSRCT